MNLQGYHVHVYCKPEQIPFAQALRVKMLQEMTFIGGAGPVRDRPIGPHPWPMFEAWFRPKGLSIMVPWLLEN